jgi:hypothetical protein
MKKKGEGVDIFPISPPPVNTPLTTDINRINCNIVEASNIIP